MAVIWESDHDEGSVFYGTDHSDIYQCVCRTLDIQKCSTPLVKLRKATQNIKDGNLDFVLSVEGTDEFRNLQGLRRNEKKAQGIGRRKNCSG